MGGGAPVEVIRTQKWTESTFGEGPSCFLCHVQIPSKFNHLLPPMIDSEVDGLKETWEEEHTLSSRLACQITLERKHDGMVVFVPDAPPVDII
jgi:ferredoxin